MIEHLSIDWCDKIGLIGDNGTGKTTFLNMIYIRKLSTGHNLRIGYYSQLREILAFEKTILGNILPDSIYDETMTRIVLARLGFRTNDVLKKVAVLSDGEKAKINLTKFLTGNFNFLMMDEPTNFLDIHAIENVVDSLLLMKIKSY